uniref:Uroporphyrinogen decarboxylase n=1 Tax=Gracilinema caldarium TaxID=215591 RepID=A0A7C3I3D6_9SPIR
MAPYGVLLNFPENGPPYLKKPAFRSIRDFSIKKAPAIDDSPELSYLIRATEKLAALQKGSRPVAAPILAPVDIPILLIGIDAWLEVLLFKPEDAKTVSEIALEHFINLAKAYAKAGAAFLVTPVMFANTALVNPEISREILIPLLKEGFSHLDIPIVFHYGGNRLADTIDLYRDLPNLLGFVLDERDSFDEARKRIGPDFILMGNLNGPYMPFRSTSDIIETTKKLLENRKTDRKFVFATSGADIPFDTEPDTLAALRDVFVSPSGVSENA